MDKPWNNGRHCAAALTSLLEHLSNQYQNVARQQPGGRDKPSALETPGLRRKYMADARNDDLPDGSAQRQAKRVNHETPMHQCSSKDNYSNQLLTQSDGAGNLGDDVQIQSAQPVPFDPSNNFPFPDYTGLNLARVEEQYSEGIGGDFISLPVAGDPFGSFNGGFGNIEWESMANTWGSMQDWGPWGIPDS